MDDTAFMSHAALYELWQQASPLLERNAKCVVASTPNTRAGLFYDLCTTRPAGWRYLEMPWYLHPARDETWVEPFRKQLGEDRFNCEFNCQFMPPAI